MTVAEALEVLGLPEGSDWGRAQAAYHRLAALAAARKQAGDPGAGVARLEEAFQLLRRELLRPPAGQAPLAGAASGVPPPRRRTWRPVLLTILMLVGIAGLGWWTLFARRASVPQTAAAQPAQPPVRATLVAAPAQIREPQTGAINHQVLFARDTGDLTPDGKAVLARVAETLHYYPLDNLLLMGYADRSELAPESLAARRALAVSTVLVEKYRIGLDRIRIQDKVVDSPASKVEIYIVEGTP